MYCIPYHEQIIYNVYTCLKKNRFVHEYFQYKFPQTQHKPATKQYLSVMQYIENSGESAQDEGETLHGLNDQCTLSHGGNRCTLSRGGNRCTLSRGGK